VPDGQSDSKNRSGGLTGIINGPLRFWVKGVGLGLIASPHAEREVRRRRGDGGIMQPG
jgi:hypothetical protein